MVIRYRFEEDKLLSELKAYIDSTYKQHYVGKDEVQAFDMITAAGHGEGFCIGNILKYGSRYGKKSGRNRKDLLKIIHYAMMALHIHDKEAKTNESVGEDDESLVGLQRLEQES